jgi:dihydroorotate dehydrogenase
MKHLYISPPFGNYMFLLPRFNKVRCVYGSYTLYPRPGLFGQILKTLRYSTEHNGYRNKIGLRNKGIEWMINKLEHSIFSRIYKNDVVSIAIKELDEVDKFLEKIPDDTNLEINVSCPNTEKDMEKRSIEKFLNPKRKFCSVKCSPLTTFEEVDYLYKIGFRTFHFSNTYPTKLGGISGITLIPFTSKLVKYTKDKYRENAHIIAGGGVRNTDTSALYESLGADSISISTLCFNPFLLINFYIKTILS